MARRRNNTPM